MKDNHLKILFYILACILLAGMLFVSRDAGISGDEKVHYEHSEKVYDYFMSMGKDQDAINTPETHLQYYGQLPDNIAAFFIHWFEIEDIYGFRHLFSAFLGWLAIFVSALFARWLKGYWTAIITLILFAVSPRFMGHAQNNLKDIPFALAYIAGVFYILKLTYINFKSETFFTIPLLVASIALSIGIRAGGIILLFYLVLAAFLCFMIDLANKKKILWKKLKRTILLVFIISLSSYLVGILLWPYALQNPFVNPWKSAILMTNFTTSIQQLFEGKFFWSEYHPWYYLPKYMLITIPVIVFLGLASFIVFSKKIIEPRLKFIYYFLFFTFLFPVLLVIILGSNLYGAWRHFIFVYPVLVILASVGLYELFLRMNKTMWKAIVVAGLVILVQHPFSFMIKSHPYYYLYYNQFVGGLKGAYGSYETDYYYATLKSGAEWLKTQLKEDDINDRVVVGSNFPVDWYFRDMENIDFVYFRYNERNEKAWDYALIGNSYIDPIHLNNGTFPPEGTIHEILVDEVPVSVVVKKKNNLAAEASGAYDMGDYNTAELLYKKAVVDYQQDEYLYYKLGKCLNLLNQNEDALSYIGQSIAINPTYEPSLFLLGTINKEKGDLVEAKNILKK